MIKTSDAVKRQLKEQYEQACNAYLKELRKMWELDGYYGYWIGDEVGGVWDYGDGSIDISMENIIYCVEHDVTREQFDEWTEYICDASEFNMTTPNLRSFLAGCPRTSKEKFEELKQMKRALYEAVEEEKKRHF